MKNFKYIVIFIFVAGFSITACQDDEASIGDIIAPSNIVLTAEIVGVDALNPNGDGSGFVNLTATANGAITYNFSFGDGLSEIAPSGEITHRFSIVGLNTYTVVVNAIGTGGISSSTSINIDVFSSFDDPEAKDLLSGGTGSSRTWYLAASEVAHLGVGPENSVVDTEGYWYPKWYAAQPFEKCGIEISNCLCDDELIFSLSTDGQLTYELNNNSGTFFNAGHQDIVGGSVGEDACFDFDTSGTSIVSLAPTSIDWTTVLDPDFTSRGTVMNFANDAFMGYYVGSSSYEIISITETSLYVRTVDGQNPDLAWYHKFSTSAPTQELDSEFNNLVWSDEFDTDGTPNVANWTYDLGAGGWGNNEEQTYTDNAENVIVDSGLLKITAKADGVGGYTSTRMKTKELYEFTYGRVDINAKLPEGGGTWPAFWMLGANFDTVGWPACGEIDIMEHVGNNPNTVQGYLHFPGNSGGNGLGNSTSISTATSEFHTYTVEWTADVIKFAIDGTIYYNFDNTPDTPYNADFFLILNIAMGGSLGGTIDSGFTESTMEIEYVRVYQ